MGIEVAAIAAIAAAAAGTGYSIVAGQQGARAQRDAMNQQAEAQNRAAKAAGDQANKSEQAIREANRNAPDVSNILANASKMSSGGAASTMLTGPGGVDPSQLSLGRSTLLGE
ncbi:hypothetical protein UFOVP824_44 [uncultured Caudovirales phage]|uniref:Uncharacterized protein n=1 Tax=uncultured Caudovirales phage TaxID=2100421 RepID=A0A6J5PCI4_9CAUD|nr:hypothetical protein UFOVP824_44 [uncultured Caudovirales phage]